MDRRKFINTSGILAIGTTADLKLSLLLGSSSSKPLQGIQEKPGYRLNQNGSFDIYTEEIALRNCYPIIDNKQIMPLRLTISDNGNSGRIKYDLDKGSIIINFDKSGDTLLISPEILGFSHAPKWFMPIGSAIVEGGESFFHQGFDPSEKSGIVSFHELKNGLSKRSPTRLNAVNSYFVSAILSSSDKCLAWTVNDNSAFLNRSSIYNSDFLSVPPDNFPTPEKAWLNFGYSLENITLAREILSLPSISFNSGTSPYNTITALLKQIATDQKLSIKKAPSIWTSEDYDNEGFGYEQLKLFLASLKASKENAIYDTILIDSGYCISGDWLLPDSRWPGGLAEAATIIDRNLYLPGISLSPFVVSEKSALFKNQRDWFLRDENDSLIIAEHKIDGLCYILDTSNAGAFNYLQNTFRTLRASGFRHFKTDYMNLGYRDSTLVKRNSKGKTSAHYYNEVLMMIRKEIGPESFWQVADAPYQAFTGYADSMKVTSEKESEAPSDPKQELSDMHFAQIFNNVLWQNDSGKINFDKRDQKEDLEKSFPFYYGITRSLISTSQNLTTNPEALSLWQLIKPAPSLPEPCFYNWHIMNKVMEVSSKLNEGLFALLLINTLGESQDISIDIHERFKLNKIQVFKWTKENGFVDHSYQQNLEYKMKANEMALFYIGAENLKKPGQISLSGAVINKKNFK